MPIILKKNLSVLMENKRILGRNIQILLQFSTYCRESKIQHPTSRVVGTLKSSPIHMRIQWFVNLYHYSVEKFSNRFLVYF